MPAIDVQATAELECVMQERQARAAGLPTGLGAKVTLAANLSAVIAELHRQGHHVVDLKPVNVRFYTQTLYMAILDCDGFSIEGQGERFHAHQVTPDYLAPEFQDRKIPEALEEQQDRFALAVVVFQLLNFGIHPFTGRPASERVSTDIPGRIAQRCYAYGLVPNPNLAPSPVSGHQAMPADLRALFDRAFEGLGGNRPTAAEWASALKVYAQRSNQRLVLCVRDRQHQHFVGLPCAACARGALIANTARSVEAAKSAWASSRLGATGSTSRLSKPMSPQAARALVISQSVAKGAKPGRPARHLAGPVPIPTLLTPTSRLPGWAYWGARFAALAVALIYLFLIKTCGMNITPRLSYAPPPVPPATAPMQAPSSTPAPTRPDTIDGAIRMLLATVVAGDRAGEMMAMENLRHFSGRSYREYKQYSQQYERGVFALENADRNNASDWFKQAIGDDPYQPQAWYGLAVASRDDSDAIGALAVAELIREGSISDANSRKVFTPQMMAPLGIDPARFDQLKARARVLVARIKGAPPR
jgi:hypothetical protein